MKNFSRAVFVSFIAIMMSLTVSVSYAAVQATPAEIAEYNQLVQNSYSMPEGLNFQRTRDLYVKLPGYTSYGVPVVLDFQQFGKRVDAKDPAVAGDIKKYSARHFALPEVHSRAMVMFQELGDAKSAQYEEWLRNNLIPALMQTGDGKTPETAFKVIIVSEEYMLARHFFSGKPSGQRVVHKDGHTFDVLSGISKQNGTQIDIWYNIDPIWAASY